MSDRIGRLLIVSVLLALQGCATAPQFDAIAQVMDSPALPYASSSASLFDAGVVLRRGHVEIFRCISSQLRRDGIAGATDESVTGVWHLRIGQRKGLWIWKKTWQMRARVVVFVLPRLDDAMSEIGVRAEVEERPNDNYPWSPDARREDALQVADALVNAIVSKCGE